jgi:hypothetical protein
MESDHCQQLVPGDLVYMREWYDECGWVTHDNQVFMILDVREDPEPGLVTHGRDVVRFSGGGWEGETLAGYFVRCDGEKIEVPERFLKNM